MLSSTYSVCLRWNSYTEKINHSSRPNLATTESNQGLKCAILVYTPGLKAWAHPSPKLVIPTNTGADAGEWINKGPPLSPWQVSTFPWYNPAHNTDPSILTFGYIAWHSQWLIQPSLACIRWSDWGPCCESAPQPITRSGYCELKRRVSSRSVPSLMVVGDRKEAVELVEMFRCFKIHTAMSFTFWKERREREENRI